MLYLNDNLNGETEGKPKFNFNKCCIWIHYYRRSDIVVSIFNFNKCCIWMGKADSAANADLANLTLTSVVFEFTQSCTWMPFVKFIFNKCCIWMQIIIVIQ